MRAFLLAIATLLVSGVTVAYAQTAESPGDARKCQTIRTCNFSRTASVRGCLSSYTCRSCRLVTSKCTVGGLQGPCEKFVCSWGG